MTVSWNSASNGMVGGTADQSAILTARIRSDSRAAQTAAPNNPTRFRSLAPRVALRLAARGGDQLRGDLRRGQNRSASRTVGLTCRIHPLDDQTKRIRKRHWVIGARRGR